MPSRSKAERGCLYKLEVTNFKSYGGTLTIGPFKDFTCVIGPNGSGKSNLMDAVSFVMGVNTKDLRGAKVADFRSHGLSKSDANTSVTLHHRDTSRSEDDDTSGETLFKRTIIGDNTSEYRIDGKKVTEKEYQAKLKSIGLLVKSRNFLVFQNEVTKVAQKSPKELTELIERVSGSEDHKADYESLQEKKKEGSDKVVGLYRRKELVNKELKQCKEAVREANTYQRYVDELKQTKTLKTLFDAYHLERHMEKHAKEVEEHEESRKKLDKECAVLEKQMKIKGQEKAQKQKEWAVQDQRAQDIEKEIKKIQRNDSIKVQTTIKSARVDFEQSTAEAAQAAEKKKEVSRSLKSDEERLSEHEKDLKKEEAANVSKDIQLQGSQVSQYNQLKLKADAETQKAKEAFDKTNREQLADDRELTQTQESHQRLQARLQEREKQVQNYSGEKNSVSEKLQKLQHDKQKLDSDLTDAEVKYRQEKNHKEQLVELDSQYVSELANMKADMSRNEAEDKKKRNVEKLKSTFNQGGRQCVLGRVSDLCKVRQKRYDLAMVVVMENHFDSIVVDNTETVKKCVDYLKEQKWHPMTFLPLESISVKPPEQRLRELQDQKIKLAVDLLEFEEPVTKAMWYACGNTLVTETLEQAKALAYGRDMSLRVKVVTEDGTLISKSGIMTGGDSTIFESKLKQRASGERDKLEEKYRKNHAALEACKANILQITTKLSNDRRNRDDIDNKLKRAKSEKEESEGLLKSRKIEVEKMKKQSQEFQDKIDALNEKIENRKAQLQKEEKALNEIKDRVFAGFCKELGIKSIDEYEGGSLAEARQRQEKLNSLSKMVETLKAKVKRQKKEKEMYEAKIQEKEQDAKAAEKKLKDMEEKAKEVDKKLKTALDQKQEVIGSREEVKKEQAEIEVTYKQYQVVHKEKSEAREEVVRNIELAEKSVEQAKEDYKALLNQSKLEDLELPRRDGSKKKKAGGDDEMEEDEEEGGGDEDMQDSQEGESQGQSQVDLARQEVKKLNLDYSQLTRDYKKEMSEKEQEQKRKEFREIERGISEKLQGMNPNMKAAEQLKEIEGRFGSLSNEWMGARKECDELSEEFEQVKKLRCDKFNKCFEHVTGCIDEMYKELTIDPTSGGSVGGSAYLTLNSQDEPYTSGIKYDTIPPGKRFMDMVNLSGGEKTVAALALIFAINSYNPAPFIVLDEVDAALDAQNVAKVTRFIQARREEQQCVIISLKERFYEKADGLVGICKSAASGHSNAFTLDLQLYDDQVATA